MAFVALFQNWRRQAGHPSFQCLSAGFVEMERSLDPTDLGRKIGLCRHLGQPTSGTVVNLFGALRPNGAPRSSENHSHVPERFGVVLAEAGNATRASSISISEELFTNMVN